MSYASYHKLKVLVVDDFESFRQTLMTMLQNFGVESIDSAESGDVAMKWCLEKKYDLVLADYNLGRGRNGQQILEQLRHEKILTYETLFILISAESSRSIIMSAYDYEPDAYLAKPITGKSLKQRLDRLLIQRDEMMPIYKAIDQSKISEAIDLLKQQIAAVTRNSSRCQRLLGELYLEICQYPAAEAVYREALEVRSLDWAKVGMAKVKKATGEYDKAKRWLADIIKKNPLCLPAYDVLAEIHELENDQDALETVLKKAVEYSPMAILRQERLAKVAQAINDNQTAAFAYRQTVRLGTNSCHNKRENHLNFGRTAAQWLKEDQSNATDVSREAVRVLEEISSNFAQTEEEAVQALLVESQVLAGQGNKRKAVETVERAQKRLENVKDIEEVDTELDLVLALRSTGHEKEADDIVNALVTQYQNNQEALQKIDFLLDEPISDLNRKRVAAVNKEGIDHYEQQNYQQAMTCFKNAQKLFPNHIGIRLNLVQAIEGELREYGYDSVMMELAKQTLSRVKGQIKGTHKQYERYLQLHDMIKAIENRNK